jgi:hypothetical protein
MSHVVKIVVDFEMFSHGIFTRGEVVVTPEVITHHGRWERG